MSKQLYLIATIILCFIFLSGTVNSTETENQKHPFFPSLIKTETGKPVKTSDFQSSRICAGCHSDINKQWKGSMHSSAFVDPVFRALWKVGAKETDGLTDKLCGGCHTGAGVVSNSLVFKNGDFQTSAVGEEGVHCDLCHTIKESSFLETPTYEPQNASIVLDPGPVKRGPYKDSKSPFHKTAYSELHTKSEFCANCHNVFHPVSNFHIERTYDEWKYSVYAQKGIQCQDCHMMPVEKAIEAARTMKKPVNPGRPAGMMGPERDNMFTHDFVGANFTVPGLLGYKNHAAIAEKRLQNAAKLEIIAPEISKAGDILSISVKVTNVAAGHNLPTSLTEVRQMWLDICVKDDSGKEIYRSGKLDKDGNIAKKARIFNAHAVDKNGKHTIKPWEITRFEYNHTIPPKGSATETYTFLIPEHTKGKLNIKAVLRYRSYPQSVANLLLGQNAPVLPIVDMNKQDVTIPVI